MATITMNLEEYQEGIARQQAAENELAKLRDQLAIERQAGMAEGGQINAARLEVLVRQAMTIVRFAVGNLPPETTRNWPLTALRSVVDHFDALPSYGIDDRDLCNEIRSFIREVESVEAQRRATRAVGS